MTAVIEDHGIQQTLDVSATAPSPAVVKEEPFDPATFESAAAPLPLPSGSGVEALFGRFFNPQTATAAAAADIPITDPAASDAHREIESLFGPAAVADIFPAGQGIPAEPTTAEIDATTAPLEAAEALEEMSELFGPAGAAAVADAVKANQSLEASTVLVMPRLPTPSAAAAAPAAAGKAEGETWIMDLPSIYGNRRTLHVEAHPFNPNSAESVKRESGPRALYTPYNTIRWTKIDGKGGDPAAARLLSNARMVRWSDGSVTLHVGADVYSVRDSTVAALRVVGRSIRNPADDSRVFIETVPYSRQVLLQPAMSIPNSVEEALLSETTMRRSVDITSRLLLLQDDQRVVEQQPAAQTQAPTQREQFAVPAAVQAAAVAALQGRSSIAAPSARLSTVPGVAGGPSLAGASQLLASQPEAVAAAATGAGVAELAEYRRQHDRQREQKLRELQRQGKSCSPFDVLSSDIEAADVCRAAQGGDLARLHATLEAQVRAAQARGIEEAQRKRAAGRLDARRIDTDELERELASTATAGRRRSRSSSPLRVTIAAANAPTSTAAAAAAAAMFELPAAAYTSKEALREAAVQRLDAMVASAETSDEVREMAKMQAEMLRGDMGDALSLDTLRDTWTRFVQDIASH